jgi:CDP-diacylglycerol--glycerol-3-phosphate 3-phosphatidyltransferase
MAPVLWVLAVLSTITVVHRIIYTAQQTRILDEKIAAEAAAQQVVPADRPKQQDKKSAQQIPSFN